MRKMNISPAQVYDLEPEPSEMSPFEDFKL
jgi:hypothetical protein